MIPMASERASATWLLAHRKAIYSQDGEEGVLAAILQLLPSGPRWCVEFGAADGTHLSNTRHFIESHGFSAVLLESDRAKFDRLSERYGQHPTVATLNALVGFTATDNLDHLLARTGIPRDFDLLSIDIDGNDYHVWAAMTAYSPRVVCIEFNPTIATECEFVQPAEVELMQGASLAALTELGRQKGYELVSVLYCNAIFVRREFFPLFGIENNAPEVLRSDRRDVTYLFFAHDGTVLLRGGRRNPWHKLRMSERRVQMLPRFLRRYPTRYGLLHWLAFSVYVVLTDPKVAVDKARRVMARIRNGPQV